MSLPGAPYRLFFEWLSDEKKPILRLLAFVPKKHRLCDSHHTSELDRGGPLVDGGRHRELDDLLRFGDRPEVRGVGHPLRAAPSPEEKEPAWIDHDEESEMDAPAEVGILVEPADTQDLIDLYASAELLKGFADHHGFSPEERSLLAESVTTDDAIAAIERIDPDAVDRFTQFLLDGDAPSDLERFYRLSGENFDSIAERPLSCFLLAVDEEQQKAIDKPMGKRPFMVGGAAGTGKSVVCLYRLHRMARERTNETLFDHAERPSYLFVTFTNALVESARSLFAQLGGETERKDIDIRFSTLDAVLSEAATHLRNDGATIPFPERNSASTTYWRLLRSPDTPDQHRKLLEEVGVEFFSNEVDEVLVDRDVETLDDYLEKGERKTLRKGLILPLKEPYRRAIWFAYEQLIEDVARTRKAPFSIFRRELLTAITENPDALKRHHVVVADEIQDLGEIQLKLITRLVRHPAGLLLARDTGQTIYRRQSAISSIDTGLRFNSQNSVLLKRSYRMTRQIHLALAPLREEVNRLHRRNEHGAEPVYSGPRPRWLRAPSHRHYDIVCDEIQRQIDEGGVNPAQFAVLFPTNADAKGFFEAARTRLPVHLHDSRNFRVIESHKVHVLTAHSSKGLEFPHVYLPHAHRLASTQRQSARRFDLSEQHEAGLRLLYVAGSRASANLTLLEESDAAGKCLDLLRKEDWAFQDLSK